MVPASIFVVLLSIIFTMILIKIFKHRWRQFHLSTLIVMVLIAGALLGHSLIRRPCGTSSGWSSKNGQLLGISHGLIYSYGWPIPIVMVSETVSEPPLEDQRLPVWHLPDIYSGLIYLAVNLLVNGLILVDIWVISEWWIRRRKPKSVAERPITGVG